MCIYNILYAEKRMASVNRKIAKFLHKKYSAGQKEISYCVLMYTLNLSFSVVFYFKLFYFIFLLFVKLFTITCCIVVFALCEWFMWRNFPFFFSIYKQENTAEYITQYKTTCKLTQKSQLYYSNTTTTIERIQK